MVMARKCRIRVVVRQTPVGVKDIGRVRLLADVFRNPEGYQVGSNLLKLSLELFADTLRQNDVIQDRYSLG
jgi:hypothetical protein